MTDHDRTDPLRRRAPLVPLWLVGLVVALIGLGVFAITVYPGRDDPADPPRGSGIIGGGPGEGTLDGGPGGATAAPTGPAAPGASGAATPSPSADPSTTTGPIAALIASHAIVPSLLNTRITITVTNPAAPAQAWRTVGIQLTGVNLAINNLDPKLPHTVREGLHCFSSNADLASVPGGGSVSFTFEVTNLLGGVGKLTVDPAVCD